jgi:hypothetical protein
VAQAIIIVLCIVAGPAKNGLYKDKNGLFVQFSVCANLKKDPYRNLQP